MFLPRANIRERKETLSCGARCMIMKQMMTYSDELPAANPSI